MRSRQSTPAKRKSLAEYSSLDLNSRQLATPRTRSVLGKENVAPNRSTTSYSSRLSFGKSLSNKISTTRRQSSSTASHFSFYEREFSKMADERLSKTWLQRFLTLVRTFNEIEEVEESDFSKYPLIPISENVFKAIGTLEDCDVILCQVLLELCLAFNAAPPYNKIQQKILLFYFIKTIDIVGKDTEHLKELLTRLHDSQFFCLIAHVPDIRPSKLTKEKKIDINKITKSLGLWKEIKAKNFQYTLPSQDELLVFLFKTLAGKYGASSKESTQILVQCIFEINFMTKSFPKFINTLWGYIGAEMEHNELVQTLVESTESHMYPFFESLFSRYFCGAFEVNSNDSLFDIFKDTDYTHLVEVLDKVKLFVKISPNFIKGALLNLIECRSKKHVVIIYKFLYWFFTTNGVESNETQFQSFSKNILNESYEVRTYILKTYYKLCAKDPVAKVHFIEPEGGTLKLAIMDSVEKNLLLVLSILQEYSLYLEPGFDQPLLNECLLRFFDNRNVELVCKSVSLGSDMYINENVQTDSNFLDSIVRLKSRMDATIDSCLIRNLQKILAEMHNLGSTLPLFELWQQLSLQARLCLSKLGLEKLFDKKDLAQILQVPASLPGTEAENWLSDVVKLISSLLERMEPEQETLLAAVESMLDQCKNGINDVMVAYISDLMGYMELPVKPPFYLQEILDEELDPKLLFLLNKMSPITIDESIISRYVNKETMDQKGNPELFLRTLNTLGEFVCIMRTAQIKESKKTMKVFKHCYALLYDVAPGYNMTRLTLAALRFVAHFVKFQKDAIRLCLNLMKKFGPAENSDQTSSELFCICVGSLIPMSHLPSVYKLLLKNSILSTQSIKAKMLNITKRYLGGEKPQFLVLHAVLLLSTFEVDDLINAEEAQATFFEGFYQLQTVLLQASEIRNIVFDLVFARSSLTEQGDLEAFEIAFRRIICFLQESNKISVLNTSRSLQSLVELDTYCSAHAKECQKIFKELVDRNHWQLEDRNSNSRIEIPSYVKK
eukprot:snap_masked-scaffold_5-processed-gene-17.38-mRNA-1 protein AED:1.00 eAED:1.00 QI:0/-1/0/0/-1/1/1/0/1008